MDESFAGSNGRYEANLRAALGSSLVQADLDEKHVKMRKSAFLFLRATCFRWAEQAAALCPDLVERRRVASVGDAHAGNFGLWRDAQARLVWGINDYDEAALTPWPLDLVRLAASLVLALGAKSADAIGGTILDAYRKALNAPSPFVLERHHLWLRDAFAASERERERFWKKLAGAPAEVCDPASFEAPLRHTLGAASGIRITRRAAGVGSLGRPRFVGTGNLAGGPVAAEIKASLPSAWVDGRGAGLARRIANGRFRSPDPTLAYGDGHVVRRLAPNNRKLDFDTLAPKLHARLMSAMAAELAAIHAADTDHGAIVAELDTLAASWLADAAKKVAKWTAKEWSGYRQPA